MTSGMSVLVSEMVRTIPTRVFVKKPTGDIFALNTADADSIGDIKTRIAETVGIPVQHQWLQVLVLRPPRREARGSPLAFCSSLLL